MMKSLNGMQVKPVSMDGRKKKAFQETERKLRLARMAGILDSIFAFSWVNGGQDDRHPCISVQAAGGAG
jgi:hypothetical protein